MILRDQGGGGYPTSPVITFAVTRQKDGPHLEIPSCALAAGKGVAVPSASFRAGFSTPQGTSLREVPAPLKMTHD